MNQKPYLMFSLNFNSFYTIPSMGANMAAPHLTHRKCIKFYKLYTMSSFTCAEFQTYNLHVIFKSRMQNKSLHNWYNR
jgi:hypothetical protein